MLPVLVLQQVGLIGRGRRAKGLDDLEATTTFVHHVDADATRAVDLPAYEHGTKKMQRIHFRTNHSARVTGQRRVFFRVSGRVVTMVEASRFSWRVYVPSWLTNAERDSSKDARS